MKTLLPLTITDDNLQSSSIPEDEAAPFDAATVYGIGDTCLEAHHIYSSMIASNAGRLPSQNLSGSTPAWSMTGYTNRWRMFDEYSNTQSANTDGSDLSVSLDVSYCSAVALFGLVGETVAIQVANEQGDLIVDTSISLLAESITDWEEYFYASRSWSDVVWFEFPIMAHAVLTITIHGDGAACGNCIVGEVKALGDTQYDTSLPMTDYSIFSTNDFGGIYLSEGAYARNVEGDVFVETSLLKAVMRVAAQLRATPTAFFCANDIHADGLSDAMVVYGVLRTFEPTISRPTVQEVAFKIVGVK